MKRVAVVILNWNGAALLETFLPSVVRHSPQANIYVADNASDDLSVELLRVRFPMVKVIRNVENYGFAQGYNEALRFVEEDIYALVNSDVEVTENWLEPILKLMDEDPEAAFVQPKILDHKDKLKFEYAGAGGGFIDRYGFPFCRGRIFDSIETDNGQYDDVRRVFWASGACLLVRKEIFRELGGFDPAFFAHMEEIDLCWRGFNRNYYTYYCGQSTVYHVGGATLEVQSPKKTYLNFRNSLLMLLKNLPKHHLAFRLFLRLVLDGIAGIRFLFQGKFEHIGAIIRAHFAFYSQFGSTFSRRGPRQRSDYYQLQSVVWSYFVRRRKRYSDF
jgi:GT2 family glycosyltransferase